MISMNFGATGLQVYSTIVIFIHTADLISMEAIVTNASYIGLLHQGLETWLSIISATV